MASRECHCCDPRYDFAAPASPKRDALDAPFRQAVVRARQTARDEAALVA
ncbi:hypothetical protein SC1_00083 [Sphingopyxis sp. C-1]|nr:hypothetical protein SC1_00083 [Sphingopyxis sp. C-1]